MTDGRGADALGARIARSRLIVHFLTLREDGFFWSEGPLNRRTVLVR